LRSGRDVAFGAACGARVGVFQGREHALLCAVTFVPATSRRNININITINITITINSNIHIFNISIKYLYLVLIFNIKGALAFVPAPAPQQVVQEPQPPEPQPQPQRTAPPLNVLPLAAAPRPVIECPPGVSAKSAAWQPYRY